MDGREPAEARILGLAFLIAGSVSLFAAALPFSPTAPTRLTAAFGLLGLVLGLSVRRLATRLGPPTRHGLLLLSTAAVTTCLLTSTTDAGRALTTYGFVWIAVHTAWFHRWRAMAGHVAAIGLGLAVALLGTGSPAPLQTWVFVMASVTGVAGVLNGLVARLRHLARHDQLTGLLNRRAFAEVAEAAMADARRSGRPLSLAVLDLDGFKLVNDRRGHAAGDDLLVELAASWRRGLRRGDVLGRQGGDEFVLLLPATSEEEAHLLLERLHRVADAGAWSSGVAAWAGDDLSRWLRQADEELYRDKEARRASLREAARAA